MIGNGFARCYRPSNGCRDELLKGPHWPSRPGKGLVASVLGTTAGGGEGLDPHLVCSVLGRTIVVSKLCKTADSGSISVEFVEFVLTRQVPVAIAALH